MELRKYQKTKIEMRKLGKLCFLKKKKTYFGLLLHFYHDNIARNSFLVINLSDHIAIRYLHENK